MDYKTNEEVSALVRSFEQLTLPLAAWTSAYSHELVAFHAEASAPHRYFADKAGPSILEVSEALESNWELGQLVRRSIAQDLPTLGRAQVFLPIHASELANESIYKNEDTNLLPLMRERIVLSIAEDDFINDTDILRTRISKLKELGYASGTWAPVCESAPCRVLE